MAPPTAGLSFDDVVRLARCLPGVTLHVGRRARALKVRGRLLARFRDEDRTLVLRMPIVLRDVLRAREPARFFLDRSYHDFPYVLVRLEAVDASALAPLLAEGHRSLRAGPQPRARRSLA